MLDVNVSVCLSARISPKRHVQFSPNFYLSHQGQQVPGRGLSGSGWPKKCATDS